MSVGRPGTYQSPIEYERITAEATMPPHQTRPPKRVNPKEYKEMLNRTPSRRQEAR
jgi:hypothetical protein